MTQPPREIVRWECLECGAFALLLRDVPCSCRAEPISVVYLRAEDVEARIKALEEYAKEGQALLLEGAALLREGMRLGAIPAAPIPHREGT